MIASKRFYKFWYRTYGTYRSTSAAAGIRIHDHRHTSNLSRNSYIIRHSTRVDRRRSGKPQAGRGPGNFKLNRRDFKMATVTGTDSEPEPEWLECQWTWIGPLAFRVRVDEKHLANVCSSPGPGPGPQAPRCLQTLTKTSQTLSPKLEHLNLAKNTCARETKLLA